MGIHNRLYICRLDPSLILRTALCFTFYVIAGFLCCVSLVWAHYRMNERARNEPLQDLLLDNIDTLTWGFQAADYLIKFYSYSLILICVVHRDRLYIMSRFFFIMGVLFIYRGAMIPVTNLPVPNYTKNCSEVMGKPSWENILVGAGEVAKTMGMDIKYCGDYMYSGHTLTLLVLSQFIYLYLPVLIKATQFYYLVFRILNFCVVHAAILCILLSKEHYTIDVLVAYFFSSRTIHAYHNKLLLLENQVNSSLNFDACETNPWFMRILLWIEAKNKKTSYHDNKFQWPILFREPAQCKRNSQL